MNHKEHQSPQAALLPRDFAQAMEHPLIRTFVSNPVHMELVKRYMEKPTPERLERLNKAFKIFNFAVRFTKYLSTLIRKGRIDFVRRMKRTEEREQVIFDRQISEEDETVIGEMLGAIYQGDDLPQVTVDPEVFQQQLNNEWLYEAFARLTNRQKVVITLTYSALSRDVEIARLLHVTQQAVSKTRRSALRSMRKVFPT
ncbi:sigma-70 family RNA polymerase sigma factor [Paenibacillus xylaniclasticus]|uniref:sigma-70 family RNA polymerase sigma factor n=1 Tax=Paenibacillus xylaniclasticus TaxID=588083 RepID=UPI000FDB503F|nr:MULTISPECIES: sigma-70 family RNA polymerase sigma factor [Paenibacillus]GFN31369.1 hypothetical protein PCURB6_16290 [Paenibacillus curdlanolyticus]